MATQKIVLKTDTFENQRVKINEIGQDTYNILTGGVTIENLSVDGYITESTDGGTTYWNVVTQQDVGTAANQVPLNQYLGQLAFLDDFSPNGLRREGGSSDDVVVNASGNVGIGISSPQQKLHVDTGALLATNATAPHIRISADNTDASDNDRTMLGQATGANHFVNSAADNDTVLRGTSTGNLLFGVGTSEKLRITSAGLVGIGTTSPSTSFHVNGSGDQYITVTSSNAQKTGIQFGNTSDPDAGGIRYANDNSFRIRTNNAERMRIDSSGNVGIGTASPGNMLHISGASPAIRLSDTGANGGAFDIIEDNNGLLKLRNDAGNSGTGSGIAFDVDAAERMRIDSSGNVGIGTTAPQVPLDLIANASGYGIALRGRSADGLATFRFTSNNYATVYSELISTSSALAVNVNNTERLRIDSSGKLLVGTSSWYTIPDSRFALPWTFGQQIKLTDSNNRSFGGLAIISATTTVNQRVADLSLNRQNGNTDYAALSSGNSIGSVTFNGADGSKFVRSASITAFVDGTPGADDMPGRLVFATTADGASSPTERLRIDSSGRVGIGTSSPSAQLDILSSGFSNLRVRSSAANSATINLTNSDRNYSFNTNSGNFYIRDESIPSERLRITSAGRVGIGTSIPGTNFHLNNNPSWAAPTGGLPNNTQAWISSGTFTGLGLQGSSAGASYVLFSDENDGDAGYISYQHTDDSLRFGVNAQERLRIDSSGNVGIGTTSPVYTLDCRGTFYAAVASGSNNITLGDISNGTQSTIRTSNSNLIFSANASTESFRVDSSSRLLVGTSTSRNVGHSQEAVIQTFSSVPSQAAFTFGYPNQAGTILSLAKSRSTSIGTRATVANGDTLGDIRFAGDDGVDLETIGASIKCVVDGTAGTNDMPGRLVFSTTADGASSPTERLRIDSSGNVGIGTSSPSCILDVQGGAGSTIKNLNAQWVGSGTNSTFRTDGVFDFQNTSGTNRLRIDSSGNVGIGTSSPDVTLHLGTTPAGAGSAGVIGFGDISNYRVAEIEGYRESGSFAGSLIFKTQPPVSSGSSGTERMRIDSSGRVGIGTSAPGSLFTLAVPSQGSGDGTNAGGQTPLLNSYRVFEWGLRVTGESTEALNGRSAIQFRTNPGTGGSDSEIGLWTNEYGLSRGERMTITSTGRVGIGTKSPGTNFHLNNNPSWAAPSGGLPNNTQAWISSNTFTGLGLQASSAGASYVLFSDENDGDAGYISYQHTDDSLRFGVNAQERLRITSTGLVGIGTSSPSAQLDILSSGFSNLRVRSSAANSATINLTNSDRNYSFNTNSGNFYIRDESIPSERLRIDSAGRVGIGTTNPDQALSLQGLISTKDSNGTTRGLIGSPSWDTSYFAVQNGTLAQSPANAALTQNVSGITYINSASGRQIGFSIGQGEKARIDSSGRLLVGTSSAYSFTTNSGNVLSPYAQVAAGHGPEERGSLALVVNQNGNQARTPGLFLAKNYSADLSIGTSLNNEALGEISFNGVDGSSFTRAAQIKAEVDGTPGSNDMPGRLIFSTTADGASSPTERLRIDSSGNVGIGTTSPVYTLDCRGTFYAAVASGSNNITLGDISNGTQSTIRTSNSNLIFSANASTESFRVDSSSRLLVGTSSASGTNTLFESSSTTANAANVALVKRKTGTANEAGQQLHFYNFGPIATARAADTEVGSMRFYGSQPTSGAAQEMARITCAADLVQTGTHTPGRLVFSTTATGGSPTERLRIDSSGNVGIGVTAAAEKLHVAGDVRIEDTSPRLGFYDANASGIGDATGGIEIFNSSGSRSCFLGATEFANVLSFGTNNSERMRIDSSGNVGIGTTNPAQNIHVTGNQTRIFIDSTNSSSNTGVSFGDNGTTVGGVLYRNSDDALLFQTNGTTERVRIDSSGNVGIGTSSPGAQLHVNSGTSNTCATFESTDSGAVINITDNNARSSIEQNGSSLKIISDTDAVGASSDIRLQVDGSTKMLIDSSGNVGIGNTNPSQSLDVVGNIKTSGSLYGPANFIIDPAAVGDDTGKVIIKGDLQIDGTTTTVNSTTMTVDDKNLELGTGAANDAAADGGGITIVSGDGNKTFQFEATGDNLGSSENLNLASGKEYKINNTSVLSATTLGSAVTGSSLTSVGTLSALTVAGDVSIADKIIHTGDTNTAIRFPAADTVTVETAGSERLRITSTGEVKANGSLQESTDGGTTYWNVVTQQDVGTAANQVPLNQYLGQLAFLDDFSPNGLRRSGGSSDDVVVNASGNVGIGTASPNSRLHVESGKIEISRFSGSYTGNTVNSQTSLIIHPGSSAASGSGSAISIIGGTASATSIFFGDTADADIGSISYLHPTNHMAFTVNADERLRITSAGNVGIGISSPQQKLHVGTGTLLVTNATAPQIRLSADNTDASDNDRTILGQATISSHFVNTAVDNDTVLRGTSTGNLLFGVGTSEKLRITSAGNVGIGTTTPTQSLDVVGNIKTSGALYGPANFIIDPAAVGDDTGTVEIKGNLTVQGTTTTINSTTLDLDHLSLGDNEIANFGASNDLQIYHDGSNSYIDDTGTGNLVLGAANFQLMNVAHNENHITATDNAQVELYHNGGKKFETTSTGATVTGNFEPEADATRDLGSATKRWANIYSADLQLSNEGAANEVDGTWGNYTIQEGEDDLFLINRRNGKKYKFNLTEV